MAAIKTIMGTALAATLVLSGCADRGDWAGEWVGRRPVLNVPGTDPAAAQTLALVKLTVNSDGTFRLTEEGFGKRGSGAFGSDSATLEVKSVEGLAPSETKAMMGRRKLRLRKDGTIEFVREGDPVVVLTRRPAE